MKIKFIDLKRQQETIRAEIDQAIAGVLDHGRYIMGPEIQELEAELAQYCGVDFAIGCASGTDALLLPLMAYNVGPGDAVFTPPFTFIATAEVISLLGAEPVFVDIDPKTYNMDPQRLDEAIVRIKNEDRLAPKGVIPVDLFGLPADYDAIMRISEKHGLFVLEDAAQGFGGQYKGRRACSFGHVAATSFFPAKPLGCYGDGGAVMTDDDELASLMKSIRVHGQGGNKYDNVRIGLNARLDTIQAAILKVKLSVFPKELEERQRVADRYTTRLKGKVETPFVPEGCLSSWAQYSVQTENRDDLLDILRQSGVPTAVYYPKPLHLQEAFSSLPYQKGDFPNTEKAAQHIFSLPMHPYLTDAEVDWVCEQVTSAL
jgi:UDP-2-acetamido-2-deoxy-ribo-hexuluronate aminotransferase